MKVNEIHVVLATTSTRKIERMTSTIEAFEFKTGIKLIPQPLYEIVKIETDCIEPYYNYEANAELKADVAYFNLNESPRIITGDTEWLTHRDPYIIIANDSGVELDAFDGWPGIFTKRCGEPMKQNPAETILDRVSSDMRKNHGSIVAATSLMMVRPLSGDRVAGAPEDRREQITVTASQDIIIDGSFCQKPANVYDICVPCVTLSNGARRTAPTTIAKMSMCESMAYGDHLCESILTALHQAKIWMEAIVDINSGMIVKE